MKRSIASLLLVISTVACAQTRVAGVVFDDVNKNGKKDRRENGVANVAVSNGVSVVATDANGVYAIDVGTDNIIFISKPSGYQAPLNEKGAPSFYYIHKPAGSPKNYKYA